MDFRKLARALPAANESEALDITHLPNTMLEALVPGYGLISRYISSTLGIDISIFVSIAMVLFAVSKGGQYLFEQAEAQFRYLFMSSIYIDEHDDLFDMVMAWLAENQGNASKRSVRAKTQKGSQDETDLDRMPSDALNNNGMFDYNKWSARTPPRYEPYYGRHRLWHKGNLFLFRRSPKPSQQRVSIQWGSTTDDDILQLDCIGRSTKPIRDLLATIKVWYISRLRNTTTIRHPTPKERARHGGAWSKTSSRPSRPMETVILDAEQKAGIIKDMNEYLHPSSAKWYATRGIPYRRGYMFHGPPGTGKTSLSFALAGIFALEIYAISLQEPTLTEGDLMQLFNGLPRRCIVLLEDVDAAGLLRDGKSETKGSKKGQKGKKGKDGEDEDEQKKEEKEKGKKEEEFTLKDLARELKSISTPARGKRGEMNNNEVGGHPNRAPGTGISLSGLLNAIDGVATHEGRVLIMTTNHPEKLDAALVRPGRVDRRVSFGFARREQISELFVRMFAATDVVPDIELEAAVESVSNGRPKGQMSNGNGHAIARTENQLATLSETELEELAVEFASQLPDDTLTPAEIQGYLLLHKKEPRTAVGKAKEWVNELLQEKKEAKEKEAEDEEDEAEG